MAEHLDELSLPKMVQMIHYIDDIMIQGETEQEVQEQLEFILQHTKIKGWETNPDKIQEPAQTVNFLGIQWHCGHWEILPRAKQKILDFVNPQSKVEAQRFIGWFGFWQQRIPHLGQILAPLYKNNRIGFYTQKTTGKDSIDT